MLLEIIQVKGDGVLSHSGNSGGGEMQEESRYILKVELTGFVHRLGGME